MEQLRSLLIEYLNLMLVFGDYVYIAAEIAKSVESRMISFAKSFFIYNVNGKLPLNINLL